jgi:hypothetical protein
MGRKREVGCKGEFPKKGDAYFPKTLSPSKAYNLRVFTEKPKNLQNFAESRTQPVNFITKP